VLDGELWARILPAFMQVYFLRAKSKGFSLLAECENFHPKNRGIKLASGSYIFDS
jgi:hypothetical protein